MKIGVITSSIESLILFKFLNNFDFEYIVYFDQNNAHYGDKDFEYSLNNIKNAITFLKSKGAENIIIPPTYELFLTQEKSILPLFSFYLLNTLKLSLIGKIGFVGDYADISLFQDKFEEITKNFILTDNQKNIKNFKFPFAIWTKETTLWKYFLLKLGVRDLMLKKTIKHDLRYFKDANIDTFIPLNYGYFAFEKSIKGVFNSNKTRFHGINSLKQSFEALTKNIEKTKYKIEIFANGNTNFLTSQKKFIDILTKGGEVKLDIKNI